MRMNTTEYEFSHGQKPRGFGYWWLKLIGTDGKGSYTTEDYQVLGCFSEAKKTAVKRMKSEIGAVVKVTEIQVLP